MKVEFERIWKKGAQAWIVRPEDAQEFQALLERLEQRYWDCGAEGFSFCPVRLSPRGEKEWLLLPAKGVELFDISEDDINKLVDKLKEVKKELSETKKLTFYI